MNSRSKLFAKLINSLQKSLLAGEKVKSHFAHSIIMLVLLVCLGKCGQYFRINYCQRSILQNDLSTLTYRVLDEYILQLIPIPNRHTQWILH